MSRSLGLREDQREGQVLATLIVGLFQLEWGGAIAGKPCAYGPRGPVGARLVRDDGRTVNAKISPSASLPASKPADSPQSTNWPASDSSCAIPDPDGANRGNPTHKQH